MLMGTRKRVPRSKISKQFLKNISISNNNKNQKEGKEGGRGGKKEKKKKKEKRTRKGERRK